MSKAYRRWKNAIKEGRRKPVDETNRFEPLPFRTVDLSMKKYRTCKKALNRAGRDYLKKKRDYLSRPETVEMLKRMDATRRSFMCHPEEYKNDSN